MEQAAIKLDRKQILEDLHKQLKIGLGDAYWYAVEKEENNVVKFPVMGK